MSWNERNRTTKRMRLKPEEAELIKAVRKGSGLKDDSIQDIKHGWLKSKSTSLFFKNPLYKDPESVDLLALFKSVVQDLKEYAPTSIEAVQRPGEHLLVFDPADIHIGKLCSAFETGEDYNSEIAVRRVKEGLAGIKELAEPYKVDQILFVVGNDILHVDNPKHATTKGTLQDVSEMWYDSFTKANRLMIDVICELSQIAPVHIVYNPSNHDYMSGFMLAHSLQNYFHNATGITFQVDMSHRKYYHYHNNIIGTTHGDGAKTNDLALLMAHEAKCWQEAERRYFYTHHEHRKKGQDIMSVTIETLRSPSGTDSWHHRNGYQHAPKAVEGFLHHKQYGQRARFTHLF